MNDFGIALDGSSPVAPSLSERDASVVYILSRIKHRYADRITGG
jgi:hypothetical protein